MEAQKKRQSRKLPSQAEKRREKRRWFDKILAQRKTWEIHGGPTPKRGQIHFAQSGSTGELTKRARDDYGASPKQQQLQQQTLRDGWQRQEAKVQREEARREAKAVRKVLARATLLTALHGAAVYILRESLALRSLMAPTSSGTAG